MLSHFSRVTSYCLQPHVYNPDHLILDTTGSLISINLQLYELLQLFIFNIEGLYICEIFEACTELFNLIMGQIREGKSVAENILLINPGEMRALSEQVDSPLPSSYYKLKCHVTPTAIWLSVLPIHVTPLPSTPPTSPFPNKVFLNELFVYDSQKLNLFFFHTQLCSPHEPDWLRLITSWMGAMGALGCLCQYR